MPYTATHILLISNLAVKNIEVNNNFQLCVWPIQCSFNLFLNLTNLEKLR